MQYKRWRVVAGKGLVNAGAAALLIFLTACGGPSPGEEADRAPGDADMAPAPVENGLTLPAVWSTRALEGPIADIALSGGPRPMLAIAFEGRGFQLFDLGGDRLGEPIGFGLRALASGRFAEIDGAAVNVFPGIDRDGALKAYLYGDNLRAPAELDLPIDPGGDVLGLCSGPPRAGTGGLMDLGFWVAGRETDLITGTIGVTNGEFTWDEVQPLVGPSPLAACRIRNAEEGPLAVFGEQLATAELDRPDGRYALTLNAAGDLLATRPGEAPQRIGLREGLSVALPTPAVAMDALGTPRDGGYPFGLIVIAGETQPGQHQVVFVDTEPLVAGNRAASAE